MAPLSIYVVFDNKFNEGACGNNILPHQRPHAMFGVNNSIGSLARTILSIGSTEQYKSIVKHFLFPSM
jgi:hypothetical protein